jgi:hypothetical protein
MTVTLFKGEKRHVIRLEKPPKKGPTKPRPLSAKKFIAALAETGKMLVCHVKEVFEVSATELATLTSPPYGRSSVTS